MQTAPRTGMLTLSARIALCCCSTYADAVSPAGLKPSQMPNMAPTTKAATKIFVNLTKVVVNARRLEFRTGQQIQAHQLGAHAKWYCIWGAPKVRSRAWVRSEV